MTTNQPDPTPHDSELREKLQECLTILFQDSGVKLSEIGWELAAESQQDSITKIMSLIAEEVRKAEQDYSGCPCFLVEPCSYACTCANHFMSGGCQRCCRYGPLEQRKAMAQQLTNGGNDA